MKNKIIAKIIAIQTILYTILSSITPVIATENIININSKEDFIEFARNCTLDSWSYNKNIILNCNIDFSGDTFIPIATFGGNFIGNGFTLSGITLKNKGSYLGVFRYIQQSGRVSNLNIEGNFTPEGSKILSVVFLVKIQELSKTAHLMV